MLATGVCAILLVTAPAARRVAASTLEIGIDENMFTVNGVDKFLVFVSYFDAMDVSSTNLHSDFQYLKARHVDGIRIFPNWWDVRQDVWNAYPYPTYYFSPRTLFASNGTVQSGPLSTFLNVLSIAKSEGLLVDVSFSAESVSGLSFSEDASAIGSITTTLANGGSAYKHVLFDLQNEYNENGPGGPALTDSQVLSIRNTVKSYDPDRIVTASISHSDPPGSAASHEASAGVDAIAWHEYRDNGFWTRLAGDIHSIQTAEPDPPIYLQEPARLENDGNDNNTAWLTAAGFGADVRSAYVNGAAAWCFHTGGSFHMDGSKLQSKLQPVETTFLTCLNSYVHTGGC
ncbi:MAG TPA: hypothetical protein VFX12_12065 [Vicinamibacterales bacterium]|nr:hypothetical protein [Vicinamibacterales bacterium]